MCMPVRCSPLTMGLFCLLTFFVSSLLFAQTVPPGVADPILGRWDLTVQAADGTPYPSWVEFSLRKETELMGRFVGRFGSVRHMTQVEFADGEVLFRIPVQYESAKADLVFRGMLAGGKLSGTSEDENGKTISWTGARAPEMRRAAAPRWGRPLEIFNGKDLSGWKPRNPSRGNCWVVENGALTNHTPCVDLISEQKFTDFKLHAEFNIVPRSNSGVYLRGRHEVQINDDYGRVIDSLRMGGVYGFLKPAENASGKAGAWQSYDITLTGRRVTIVLNGKTIIDNEEIAGITGGALDSNESAPGPLMLQGDHGKIAFRKITITPAR
ncbi:MAG: DUF1080 domain-containing protein [Blastocatellia bacterium]